MFLWVVEQQVSKVKMPTGLELVPYRIPGNHLLHVQHVAADLADGVARPREGAPSLQPSRQTPQVRQPCEHGRRVLQRPTPHAGRRPIVAAAPRA